MSVFVLQMLMPKDKPELVINPNQINFAMATQDGSLNNRDIEFDG